MAAIRLLKQLEAENRPATPEEQEVLAKYVGWGGLADCFDPKHSRYEELKGLLSETEYAAARESTLTAFYTPPVVIRSIYAVLEQMGFSQGNILEPSCGVGNFLGMLPESMAESKVYGEELGKVSAYAAAAARAAGCGLERVFEGLAVGENAPRETAQDLSFYEQGGFGCTIHGESVLLGTASFLRKQDVRLPSNINLKTGIFLAIDHQLAAVFAVKYEASENVDYALRTLHRSRITPILAVRDPNITPALLKRNFNKKIMVEYPQLTDRVALCEAEEDRGLPRALLLREGLLPYAEAVVGSRRLRTAVRRASWLSLAGSAAGVLLTAYLVSLGKFDLLTPLSLTVFLLLWTLPVLLMSDWTGRY